MILHGIEKSGIASLIDIETEIEAYRVALLEKHMRWAFYKLTGIWVGDL